MRLTFLPQLLCHAGLFVAITAQNVCQRPPSEDNTELVGGQLFFEPGDEVTLSCSQGYTPKSGSRKIICKSNGEWSKRTLVCSPRQCSVPDPPQNGKAEFSGNTYQSVVHYSCDRGYILDGDSSSECLHTGQWKTPRPECIPVTCNLPPVPPFAKIVYDRKFKGDAVEFGAGGTYECLPPFALVGNKRAICMANGLWTETPTCTLVTCQPPPALVNGFRSPQEERVFGYGETVKYGCKASFLLDGPVEVQCTEKGIWSGRPKCDKAP